jgi:integral membrane sensor domain MASE1
MSTIFKFGRNEKGNNPLLAIQIAFFFFLICINSLVSKFVVFSFGVAPGVSYYYIVVVVMIVFTLWFGMWGAVAAYIGCFIGAGLLCNIPPLVGIYWSLADFWEVLIPFLACRYLNVDISIKTLRDLFIIILFGVFINNFVGAVWGSVSLAAGDLIPVNEIVSTSYAWFIGNLIVCLILLPVILYLLTPKVRQHELFVTGFWR